MADRICTRFIDDDGLDIGCHLVSKEYVLEAYPELVPWMKTPALWTWGDNRYGQLGNSAITSRSSPVQTISSGTNWKQASVGYCKTGAIKTDGTLWMWGGNVNGELGTNNLINRSSPIQTISGGTNWKSVCMGRSTIALKTDGTLWLWGANSYGTLGNNSVLSRSSPVQTVSAGTNWKTISNYISVAAIKTDGSLWLWGRSGSGMLGNNSPITDRSSPVQTVSAGTDWKQVSSGYSSMGAIKTNGTLWLWGYNGYGELGNNSLIFKSSPVQTVSSGTNWKQVSIGRANTLAIKTDGSLWGWGRGFRGNNGDGTTYSRSSPVQTVSGGTNWRQVSEGFMSTAIKTDGTLWLWGSSSYGALGNNSYLGTYSPVQTISAGNGWKSVSVTQTVAAIRDEGEF